MWGKLERYLKERPIVTVRLVNYKISVIENKPPGVYTVNNEQVNVFEAVAMAGDLTIYGKQDNVRIIRTVDGKQNLTINLNDENIIYSPTSIYGKNDIVYVEPNKAKETECQHWFFHQSFDFHNLYTYISPGGVNGQYFYDKKYNSLTNTIYIYEHQSYRH